MTPETAIKAALKGKTYRELGQKFGMDHAYIYRVANDGATPSDRLLELLGLERIVTYRRKR